jgi:hypothetical protein
VSGTTFPFDIAKIPLWRVAEDPTVVLYEIEGTLPFPIFLDKKVVGTLPDPFILDFIEVEDFQYAFVPPIPRPLKTYDFFPIGIQK